jgi:hypothetical protein
MLSKFPFFQPSSLLGNLSIIHFLKGICQGDLFNGPLFTLAHFCALWCYVGIFPFCIFSSFIDDIHIIGLVFIICFVYNHFYFLIDFCGAHGSIWQMFNLVAFEVASQFFSSYFSVFI